MKKKKIKLVLGLTMICLTLVSLTACAHKAEEVQHESVDVKQNDSSITISGSGNIEFSEELNLAFGNGGRIEKIYVEEGDYVTEGNVLAKLDTSPFELALAQAQAALDEAEYNLEQTEEPYSGEDIDIADAEVDVAEDYLDYAKWMLEQAEDDERVNGIVPVEKQWEAEVTRAKAELSAAEARWEDMVEAPDDGALEAAKSRLIAAQEMVAEAQRRLAEATIRAPFDGVVASVNAKEGDIVLDPTLSPQPIILFIDPGTMELHAKVDEIDIAKVKTGQRAVIYIDALPILQLAGRVTFISLVPVAQAGVVMYEVEIKFDVPRDFELRKGMSADVSIVISE